MSIAHFPGRRFTDNPRWYADAMIDGGVLRSYSTAEWLSCLRYLAREAHHPPVVSLVDPSRIILTPRHYRYAMRAVRRQIALSLPHQRIPWIMPIQAVRRYA